MRSHKVTFWMWFAVLLWLAHSTGYLVHEFGHTFAAYALGFKTNPLALDYGHFDLRNVLLLSEIDENVDYDAVLATGKGSFAALIAAAGMVLGSGTFYVISRWLYTNSKKKNRMILGSFAFLFCGMNVGNFLDYVPVRTFTTHADMARIESGLHISPWWVAIALGIPTAAAIWHLFARMLPDASLFLFPGEPASQGFLVVLSALIVFGFFGSAGWYGYGAVSHWISVCSLCIAFPATMLCCWPRRGQPMNARREV